MDGYRVQMIPKLSPLFLGDDQICLLQHPDMLHYCTAVQVLKMPAKASGGQGLIPQIIQYLAPDWGSQGLEYLRIFIFD